jgi:hypothetical protein
MLTLEVGDFVMLHLKPDEIAEGDGARQLQKLQRQRRRQQLQPQQHATTG